MTVSDFTHKMGRHLKLIDETLESDSHTLTHPVVAILGGFITSTGVPRVQVYAPKTVATTEFKWDPVTNTITSYSGQGTATTVRYLAEAAGV